MSDLISLIAATLLLSLVHAAIPNHWVPLVLVGRVEKWTLLETQWATLLTGFAHIFSTLLLGVVLGYIGFQLSEQYKVISEVFAPLLLIFMGLVYFASNSNHQHLDEAKILKNKSKISIISSLCISMFLSPCLEIETYFFTAGTQGIYSMILIAIVYLFSTLFGMLVLVSLGFKSLEKYNWHFLEHHERRITGSMLIVLGIISFFIKF